MVSVTKDFSFTAERAGVMDEAVRGRKEEGQCVQSWVGGSGRWMEGGGENKGMDCRNGKERRMKVWKACRKPCDVW